jgi:tetratricopeptide (TPR) repeat protein
MSETTRSPGVDEMRFLSPLPTLLTLAMFLCAATFVAAGEGDARMHWDESIRKETSGELEEATNEAAAFLKAGGDRYLGNLRTGWLLYLRKDYEKANQAYQKAQKTNPSAVSPLLGSANCLYAQRQPSAAAKGYVEVLKKDPNNYTANLALAGINYDVKAYRVAGTHFQRLESLYPEDVVVVNGLAWCLVFQGQRPMAAPLFHRVLTLNANYPNAAEGLKLALMPPEPKGKLP